MVGVSTCPRCGETCFGPIQKDQHKRGGCVERARPEPIVITEAWLIEGLIEDGK